MTRAWSVDGQLPNPKNMTKGDLGNRIAFMVEAILEGVNERHPHSMDELLLHFRRFRIAQAARFTQFLSVCNICCISLSSADVGLIVSSKVASRNTFSI